MLGWQTAMSGVHEGWKFFFVLKSFQFINFKVMSKKKGFVIKIIKRNSLLYIAH